MPKVRKVKTSSGKTAVQIVKRYGHRTFIVKHIGTAGSKSELEKLVKIAQIAILSKEKTTPLFPEFFNEKNMILFQLNTLRLLQADIPLHMSFWKGTTN